MAVKIPLTWGQIRIIVAVVCICIAINCVLYTSASLLTITSSEESEELAIKDRHRWVRHHPSDDSRRLRYEGGNGEISGGVGKGFETLHKIRPKHNKPPVNVQNTSRKMNSTKIQERLGEGKARNYSQHVAGQEGQDKHFSSTSLNKDGLSEADVTKMASNAHHEFDSEKVWRLFHSCKEEDGNLDLNCYNDAYEELCKIFKPLGAVFGFVTSDIVEKIGILRDYRKSEVGEHYRTIQGMVKYEVDNNLTNQKKKASGCRTLLRLHRALKFISVLLVKIRQTDNSCKFSHEVRDAYDNTLAEFHPWVIRKAAHVAMYTLPDRQHMLLKMKIDDTPEGMEKVGGLIEQLDISYNITQQLFESNKLLELP